MKVYELSVAARMILGADTPIKNPSAHVLYLIKRDKIPVFRARRKYVLSMEQIMAVRAAIIRSAS